jgi:hypothetical protein
MSGSLMDLMDSAREAGPSDRIHWRDPIALHGDDAIRAMRPWLADVRLCAFAIRVIDRAAQTGDPHLATRVLREARPGLSAALQQDVDWVLNRLRARRLATPVPSASRSRSRPDGDGPGAPR